MTYYLLYWDIMRQYTHIEYWSTLKKDDAVETILMFVVHIIVYMLFLFKFTQVFLESPCGYFPFFIQWVHKRKITIYYYFFIADCK